MPFDIQAAQKDGIPDNQIADYLADKTGFDIGKARNDNVPDKDIVSYLLPKINQTQADKKSEEKGQDGGEGRAALQGFNAAIPFGERLVAGMGALGAAAATGENVGDLYNEARLNQKSTEESNPKSYLAGTIGAVAATLPVAFSKAVATTPILGTAANALQKGSAATHNFISGGAVAADAGLLGKAAALAGQSARGAIVAAPTGALYGYGGSNAEGIANPERLSDAWAAGGLAAAGGAAGPILSSVAAPLARGVKSASQVVLPAKFSNAVDKFLPNTPAGEKITQDMVKQASQNAYDVVERSGTVLNPNFTNKVVSAIEEAKQKPLYGGKLLTKEQADINAALAEYDVIKDLPTSMKDLQGLDSTLGDKAAQAYVSGNRNKGRVISDVQDKIRDMVKSENLNPADITGSREGIDALTQGAIPLWSTQAKMGDIGKIIERANMMDNPTTGMRTGFRNLALNKGKMAQYPADVQVLIQKAAATGKTDDLLGIIGSRLNPIIGGASGGPVGAIGAYATSKVARVVRDSMRNNKANKIMSSLTENVKPAINKYSPPTNPQVAKVVNRVNQNKKGLTP